MSNNPNLDPQDLEVTPSQREALRAILGNFPYGASANAYHRVFPDYINGSNNIDLEGLLGTLADLSNAVQRGINNAVAEQRELEELRAQRSAFRAFLGLDDEK